MAPAPRLFFMALGRYQAFIWYNVAAGNQGLPSSGIMWQVGIKACHCSCTIWLAVSLNLGNQAAFKTREVPVLPLIQSEFWVLSLMVDQNWLPYAPSWHRIPSSLQGATCFLEGSLQNKFLLFLPCFPSPPHSKGIGVWVMLCQSDIHMWDFDLDANTVRIQEHEIYFLERW